MNPSGRKAARGGQEIPQSVIVAHLSGFKSPDSVNLQANANVKRRYPWGDEVTSNHCNYQHNIGSTSTPGCYQEGTGVYGTHDLSGNVREWTRSIYKGYLYDPTDGREDEKSEGRRVLRGGSFGHFNRDVRCAYRFRNLPYDHSLFVGFRLVALPPPE